ncbi:MAG: Glu/Leu/Phe/Val dehydrogenase [bacterium]|nr:Glu/Leu/Phe/Val dehydrogenase [bacterium]
MSAFNNALKQISRAAEIAGIQEETVELLRHPMREVKVNLPLIRDDESLLMIEGYRVQHNDWRGPFKGGIRYHQAVDLDEVRALATWMSVKTAVAGIPMGGGKGGVTVNPKELSEAEIERLTRSWTKAMRGVIGPEIDVPAPDVNTSPREMAWIADEFGHPAVVTGKPIEAGGSEGRSTATAMGGYYVLNALTETLLDAPIKTVVIQGFGNAGRMFAEICAKNGLKVLAVSDSRGAIMQADGLDIAAVGIHKDATGLVQDFECAENISNQQLLALECDLLVPAALENVLTVENARDVKAKMILELANGPTTPEADDIFFDRGIHVVPDVLANSGGVTVSYFEWDQNMKEERWSAKDVDEKLQDLMQKAADAVYERSEKYGVDLRKAAFVLALERLHEAKK